jgi:hypothetical protein
VSLTAADAEVVAKEVADLYRCCRLSSLDRTTDADKSGTDAWRDAEAGPRILVRYRKPVDNVSWTGRKLRAQEVLVVVDEAQNILGPILSRGDVPVVHIKCSGDKLIRYQCAPPVRSLVPEAYLSVCRLLDGK